MNRTDRLLAIMLQLEARKYTRAEDLAGQFEVSVRTIYRDVFALCETGVPVVSTPGYGYSMAPGYFLPPLMLTPDEAGTLLLGASFVGEQVDTPYKQAVDTARKKIEKLLPESTRQEVEFLLDSLRFINPRRIEGDAAENLVSGFRRAIVEREVLHIEYHARHGEPGSRDVEPHGLVCVNGRWMLLAYCRSRKGMRNFRLDRVGSARPTGEVFTRRDVSVRRLPPPMRGERQVQVLFTHEVARWVREERHFSFVREEEHPDGVIMVFAPREMRDLMPWLLSWGAQACVLSPPEMQESLRLEAEALARMYEE